MGWASGSGLADDVWKAITPLLEGQAEDVIQRVAVGIVAAFENHDCDTLQECDGPIGDAANRHDFELYGAPPNPQRGDRFTLPGDGVYEFDGARWRFRED